MTRKALSYVFVDFDFSDPDNVGRKALRGEKINRRENL